MASVLMCASEGLPFVKTGGLADVIGSLPAALADQGNEVKVVLPLYRKIAEKYMNDLHFCCEYTVSINYHEVPVRIWSTMVGPVAFFFVQHQGTSNRILCMATMMTANGLPISRKRSSRCSTS